MWVTQYRSAVPHMRNNTNNHIESFFGKLKKELDDSFSMLECLQTLLRIQVRMDTELERKESRVGRDIHHEYDEEMNTLL